MLLKRRRNSLSLYIQDSKDALSHPDIQILRPVKRPSSCCKVHYLSLLSFRSINRTVGICPRSLHAVGQVRSTDGVGVGVGVGNSLFGAACSQALLSHAFIFIYVMGWVTRTTMSTLSQKAASVSAVCLWSEHLYQLGPLLLRHTNPVRNGAC